MNPTSDKIAIKAKSVRRTETFFSCSNIHGGSKNNLALTFIGMIDTLTSRCKSEDLVKHILNAKGSVVKCLNDSILTKWAKYFYLSDENLLRSLNCYYSHNVLGKRKYISLLKANKDTSFKNTKVPNYMSLMTIYLKKLTV